MAWKKVCAASVIAENTLAKFELDGVAIAVANIDGKFYAFPPFCPHMAEPLEFSGFCGDGMLTCTKHLWQWDMTSNGAPAGAAERPLLLYPIKREGDDIFVEVEKELTYEYE